MGLNAEMLFIPLPCLVHFGVTFTALILGRARRRNQSGVHQRADLRLQVLLLPIGVDQL